MSFKLDHFRHPMSRDEGHLAHNHRLPHFLIYPFVLPSSKLSLRIILIYINIDFEYTQLSRTTFDSFSLQLTSYSSCRAHHLPSSPKTSQNVKVTYIA